jgi:photosystem II stability/assembly factor-like uncharacterized protein
MKKYYLAVLLFISVAFTQSFYSQSGWFWQHPEPQGRTLRSICYADANNIFAGGNFGTIIRTTNSGLNWNYITLPNEFIVWNLSFINQNTGWAAGDHYIYKTTNNGNNWYLAFQCPYYVITMQFINSSTGYACIGDTSANFSKSTDVGSNWFIVNNNTIHYATKMSFIDLNTGFIVGYNQYNNSIVLRTSDGGYNWNTVLTAGYSLADMSFLNSNTGVVAGNDGVYKSTNNGLNWYYVHNKPQSFFTAIAYSDANTLFASVLDYDPQLHAPAFYKSTDGGYSWSLISYGLQYYLYSIQFVNPSEGIGVGFFGNIMRTTNSGLNWSDNGPFITLKAVDFVNSNTGCAVGVQGYVFRTTNGGDVWNNYIVNPQYNFVNFKFANSSTGIAIGNNETSGIILRTSNGGVNWSMISENNFKKLNSLFFSDQNTGFAAGDSGLIIRTTNTGSNWEQINSGVTNKLTNVCFSNSSTGFISRYNNLLKTTDGGQNWSAQTFPGNILCIYFLNSITGFIGNENFYLYRTSNGGNNWTYQGVHMIKNISFANSTTGIAVLDSQVIYRTTDCGLTWNGYYLRTDQGFNDIKFTNSGTGYLVGSYGAILKTTNGGEPFGIKHISSEIPKSFYLSQNYPNPFNPRTKIKFEIPASPNPSKGGGLSVRLFVYDILGRKVASLIPPLWGGQSEGLLSEERLKPGTYEVEFDGTNYPSGVYFYKLSSETFSDTKKMVLIK